MKRIGEYLYRVEQIEIGLLYTSLCLSCCWFGFATAGMPAEVILPTAGVWLSVACTTLWARFHRQRIGDKVLEILLVERSQ